MPKKKWDCREKIFRITTEDGKFQLSVRMFQTANGEIKLYSKKSVDNRGTENIIKELNKK